MAALAGLWAVAASAAEAPAALSDDASDGFQLHVRPFLERFCIDCHGGREPKADLAFDLPLAELLPDADRWSAATEHLRAQTMPPDDAPMPSDAERAVALKWVRRLSAELRCGGDPDPGRVTLRRLNRAEYRNTVRDLLGIDFAASQDFPADDVGYGFDNIGDVLSLPPLLLEKYLAAAERISDELIVADREPPLPVARYQGEQIDVIFVTGKRDKQGDLPSNGEAYVSFDAPVDAEYRLRWVAYGTQAGDELPKMTLAVDDDVLETYEVAATARKPEFYERVLNLRRGPHRIAAGFLNDYYNPEAENPKQRDRNLFITTFEVAGPLDPALRPLPAAHQRFVECTPSSGGDDAADCARRILGPLVARAYRRPAEAEEVERLVQLVQSVMAAGDSFERGLHVAVQAVLVSPHFLFRVERDPAGIAPGAAYALNDHELATRLSYFLWSSMPDETLRAAADRGALRDPAELEAQVRRMLADERSQALVENFASQWLQIRNLDSLAIDLKTFPAFDPELREAMRRESELFFRAVMTEDRSIQQLLDANFTFVNEKLAQHYGIEGVAGPEFRRVSTAGTPRGGVLTQAAVLTVTSNPTRTSPVKRGRWVLEQVLGAPAPPPPEALVLDESPQAAKASSLRERLELHRANAECAVCHKRMDPLGFGLENFDAIGGWRDSDGDFPVDSSGTLPGGTTFRGPIELKTILRERNDEFRRSFADKMLTYALGRGLEPADDCALETIGSRLAAEGDRFSTLILEIVRSRPFQMRRAKASGDES